MARISLYISNHHPKHLVSKLAWWLRGLADKFDGQKSVTLTAKVDDNVTENDVVLAWQRAAEIANASLDGMLTIKSSRSYFDFSIDKQHRLH